MQSAAIQIMFGAFESMSWLNHVMNVSFIKVGEARRSFADRN